MAAVGRNRSREARDRRRDSRRELFVSPALIPKCSDVSSGASGKHKGVLSDSENEEPLSRKIRNISAFIRKTKHSAACMGGAQRSQSCSDPLEDRAGKLKALQPPLMDRVSHSFTAGILLASENSRCSSAPPPSDRRLPWRPVLLPPSSPPIPPERSVSPDSNDSISEELNHFKPIECSPCTPPRRC
ncbi:E3 ubiquitin-protein ligase RNF169 [Dissostichus eleginoides]|uniref:E3 ubiquitin-protein ligase RNF169 n=1 Tax=Dissostichus eleginoides TaxID=100907 RepID=A0AAD9CFV9_DISEL|nr:E3 ubiquitin-protein ligase RNF169 [Dissostichus eleginoides]